MTGLQENKNDNTIIPDAEASHALMESVLSHYIKHHQIVLKKLKLARNATLNTLQASGCIEKYRKEWDRNINIFSNTTLSEDDLVEIDGTIQKIPDKIKKCYHSLLESEEDLQTLMTEIKSLNYESSLKTIQKIQAQPNPLSSLSGTGSQSIEKELSRDVKEFNVDYTEAIKHFKTEH